MAVEGKLVSWIQERTAAGNRVTTRKARVRAGLFAEDVVARVHAAERAELAAAYEEEAAGS